MAHGLNKITCLVSCDRQCFFPLREQSEELERVTSAESERDEALLKCEKYQKLYDDLQDKIAPFKVIPVSVYCLGL